jgi:hypothetical protein
MTHSSGNNTDPRLLRLSPLDRIGVATQTLAAGENVMIAGRPVTLDRQILTGHKIALAPIAAGEKVLKYGAPIGSATCDIRPGDYVHLHNVKSDYLPTYTFDEGRRYVSEKD